MDRPDPDQKEYTALCSSVLESMSGWFVTSLALVLGVVAIPLTTLTFFLVVGGDYSRVSFSLIPMAIGTAITMYGFSAASLLFCERNARGILWVLPALLSPIAWLLVAAVFDIRYPLR